MSSIFAFTAINDKAVQHLDDSIINPRSNEVLKKHPLHKDELNKWDNNGKGIYAWGAVEGKGKTHPNIGRWESMQKGDYVLTVCKKISIKVSAVRSVLLLCG